MRTHTRQASHFGLACSDTVFNGSLSARYFLVAGCTDPYGCPDFASSVVQDTGAYRRAEAFPYWSRGVDREAFGHMLKLIGDNFADSALYLQALACYANSWVISREPEAALYAAAVLRGAPELNPGGQKTDQLVNSIFEQKGVAYANEDWPNILCMHTVLGTIFEREARWGSASDPRSAIFQWEHALVAQSQVQKRLLDYPPSPGLHMHLANCYLRTNRPADAQSSIWKLPKLMLRLVNENRRSRRFATSGQSVTPAA